MPNDTTQPPENQPNTEESFVEYLQELDARITTLEEKANGEKE